MIGITLTFVHEEFLFAVIYIAEDGLKKRAETYKMSTYKKSTNTSS